MKRQRKMLFRLVSFVVALTAITPHATAVYTYTWVPQSDQLVAGANHPLTFPIFTGNFQISDASVQTGTPGELIQVHFTVNYPYPLYSGTPGVYGGGGADYMTVIDHAPAPPIPIPYTVGMGYGFYKSESSPPYNTWGRLQCDPLAGALTTFNGGIYQPYTTSVRQFMRLDLLGGHSPMGVVEDGYGLIDMWYNVSQVYVEYGTPGSLELYVYDDAGGGQRWTEYGTWEVAQQSQSNVPDGGSTAALLGLGVAGLSWLRRCVFARNQSRGTAHIGLHGTGKS